MIDIRIAMNDIYKNLEPTLTKCGFRITTPADISDGIPVSVTSGRAVMDFSGDNKALRIEHYDNKIALLWAQKEGANETDFAKIAHSLLDRLQNSFVSFVKNIDTIDDSIKNSADFKARSYFFAGGVISLYSAWLRGEISGDGANIANIAGDLIMQSTLLFK